MGANIEGVIETSADGKIITFMHLFAVSKWMKHLDKDPENLLNYHLAKRLVDDAVCANLAKWRPYILETGYFSSKVIEKIFEILGALSSKGDKEGIAAIKLFAKSLDLIEARAITISSKYEQDIEAIIKGFQTILTSKPDTGQVAHTSFQFILKKVILKEMPSIVKSLREFKPRDIDIRVGSSNECHIETIIESIVCLNSSGDEIYIGSLAFESLKRVLQVVDEDRFYDTAIVAMKKNLQADTHVDHAFPHQIRETLKTLMYFVEKDQQIGVVQEFITQILTDYQNQISIEFLLMIDQNNVLKNQYIVSEEMNRIFEDGKCIQDYLQQNTYNDQDYKEIITFIREKNLYQNDHLKETTIELICKIIKAKISIVELPLETIRASLRDPEIIDDGKELREIVFEFVEQILMFDTDQVEKFDLHLKTIVYILNNSFEEVKNKFGEAGAKRLLHFFEDVKIDDKLEYTEEQINDSLEYAYEKFQSLLKIEKYLNSHPIAKVILDRIKDGSIKNFEDVVRLDVCKDFDREDGTKALILKEVISYALESHSTQTDSMKYMQACVSFLGYQVQTIVMFTKQTLLKLLRQDNFTKLDLVQKLAILGQIINFAQVIYVSDKTLFTEVGTIFKELVESVTTAEDTQLFAEALSQKIFNKFDHNKYKKHLFTKLCIDLEKYFLQLPQDESVAESSKRKVVAEFVKKSIQYGINIQVVDKIKAEIKSTKQDISPSDREEYIYFFIEGEKLVKYKIGDESGISKIIYDALKGIQAGTVSDMPESERKFVIQPVSCIPYFERVFSDSASTDIDMYSIVNPQQILTPDIRVISFVRSKYVQFVLFERRGLFGTYICDKIPSDGQAIESFEKHPKDVSWKFLQEKFFKYEVVDVESFVMPRGIFGNIPQRVEKGLKDKITDISGFVDGLSMHWHITTEKQGLEKLRVILLEAQAQKYGGQWGEIQKGLRTLEKEYQFHNMDARFHSQLMRSEYSENSDQDKCGTVLHYILRILINTRALEQQFKGGGEASSKFEEVISAFLLCLKIRRSRIDIKFNRKG